jgi:hypothetical protein
MKMRYLLVASLLTLAISAPAQARTYEHGVLSQAYNGEVGCRLPLHQPLQPVSSKTISSCSNP